MSVVLYARLILENPVNGRRRVARRGAVAPWAGGRSRDVREAALALFAERGYWGTSMKDIGEALGMRAPSLYNHVVSKQGLLREIVFSTMERALADQREALGGEGDVALRLRRATEAHVRQVARYRREVIVTNREFLSLEEPDRTRLSALRAEFERRLRETIERGVAEGRFDARSPRLAAFAILGMTNEVPTWYREDGSLSEDEIARRYADLALRLVGEKGSS